MTSPGFLLLASLGYLLWDNCKRLQDGKESNGIGSFSIARPCSVRGKSPFIARDCSLPDIQIPRSTADFCLDVSIGCFDEPSLTVSQDGQSLRAFCPSGGDPTFESLIPLLMFLLPSTSIEESNVPWLRTAGLRDTKLKMTLRDFLASSWLRTDPGRNECPNARLNPKAGAATRLSRINRIAA